MIKNQKCSNSNYWTGQKVRSGFSVLWKNPKELSDQTNIKLLRKKKDLEKNTPAEKTVTHAYYTCNIKDLQFRVKPQYNQMGGEVSYDFISRPDDNQRKIQLEPCALRP